MQPVLTAGVYVYRAIFHDSDVSAVTILQCVLPARNHGYAAGQ
jgi:hypothetical protein